MADSHIPLIREAEKHRGRTAVVDTNGDASYDQLLKASRQAASGLLGDQKDLKGKRVAFLTPRNFDYPAIQWGIWRAGGMAVPLCEVHPPAELRYTIKDSDASLVVGHPDFAETLMPISKELGLPFRSTERLFGADGRTLPHVEAERPALMLYTSGTTGKPKGVVLTHQNLKAQITSLIQAWEWRRRDRILHVLPLHHTHGIVNVLCCALWAGAACHMLPRFDAPEVWRHLTSGSITLFMAVPTIYFKLMETFEKIIPRAKRGHEQSLPPNPPHGFRFGGPSRDGLSRVEIHHRP